MKKEDMQRVKRRRVGKTLGFSFYLRYFHGQLILRIDLDLDMTRIRSMWSFAAFGSQLDAPN